MAEVLIKGMEMPKYGCDHCFLRTGNYCSRIDKDESVVEYARKSERHPDCPLVEIPPHGRLIDADALARVSLKRLGVINIGNVDDAPTVIPANEAESEVDRDS